jgi:hypothetical protein
MFSALAPTTDIAQESACRRIALSKKTGAEADTRLRHRGHHQSCAPTVIASMISATLTAKMKSSRSRRSSGFGFNFERTLGPSLGGPPSPELKPREHRQHDAADDQQRSEEINMRPHKDSSGAPGSIRHATTALLS